MQRSRLLASLLFHLHLTELDACRSETQRHTDRAVRDTDPPYGAGCRPVGDTETHTQGSQRHGSTLRNLMNAGRKDKDIQATGQSERQLNLTRSLMPAGHRHGRSRHTRRKTFEP